MSFASPDRLIWLAVALPIIALYILRTRLRRRAVATLLFWDQLYEEKRRRSLWQNLRHWLSLLLQLIFVGLVCLALADPLWRDQDDSGQELILVVDNSASMQAIDPISGRSRLAEAIDRAGDVAAGLRQGDQIALISAGTAVRVVVGMSDFAPVIEDALQTIRTTDGPTKVDEAIEAARRLAPDPQRRRIVVFSDGCVPDRSVPVADDVRWVQVGKSLDNVAITQFQVRRSTVDPIGYALLVQLQNASDQPVRGRLKLELDRLLVDVIPFSLAAGERWQTTIEGTSREGGILTGSIDVRDGLAIDNVARAVVPARPLIPVTLVSGDSESFYLRTVLESIPLLQLTIADDGWDPRSADTPNRLTVFSGTVPQRLPRGPTLIVAAAEDGPPVKENDAAAWKIGPSMESPIIASQDKDSPLLRHVELQNVLIDGGRDIDVNDAIGPSTTLLETAGGQRVAVSIQRESGRVLILAADLDSSDLPLRIAFPVMMTNAINWFFRQSGQMHPALATGQVTTVPWDVAGGERGEAMLISPTGTRRLVTTERDRASVGPLDQAGVCALCVPIQLPISQPQTSAAWTPAALIESGEVTGRLIAVNLCDPNESDLRLPAISRRAAGAPPSAGASPWLYLALLAIGLVVGEWALFNRRVVA